MCGFAGQRLREPMSADELENMGRLMISRVRHRGPDSDGLWIDSSGCTMMAFARLAIQDLSTDANQPMHSESGRYTVVYNGEIYNSGELRELIGRPVQSFRTHSDTEVLLACIEKLGLERTLAGANGMFAFALWDSATRTLFLVRDRVGKKPLHYSLDGKRLVFASEIKSMLAICPATLELDPEAVEAYFTLTYIPAPLSIFRQIRKVKPGHILEVRADMSVRERPYWSVHSVLESRTESKADFPSLVEQADALLEDSVRRRLISDVPVALLLSGGVDSSLVAFMIGQRLRVSLQSFSVGVDDAQFDESAQASAIARRLGVPHTVLPLSENDLLLLLDQMFDYLDEPFGDYSSIPTYAICKLARTKATVLLTGDGGDEVFSGYTRYIWSRGWRRVIARAYASLSRHRLLLSHKDLAAVIYERLLTLGVQGCTINPHLLQQHLSRYTDRNLSVLQCLRMLDFETYLPDDILVKTDRMSMANSAELRSPFLDYRLAEFSWTLPDDAMLRGAVRKRITRELFRKNIGEPYLQVRKYGFGTPMRKWLLGSLQDQVQVAMKELSNREDLPQAAALTQKYWPLLRRGDKSAHHAIWVVYAFWRWSQRWGKRHSAHEVGLEHVRGYAASS
jgi:asparagine synthase (glutamine-hydrolysing)